MADSNRDAMAQIVPVLFGHMAFQQLTAATRLGLFELLDGKDGLPKQTIATSLGLSDRSTDLLLLGASALRLIDKQGDEYRNAQTIAAFFDDGQWSVLRDIIEFQAQIASVQQST